MSNKKLKKIMTDLAAGHITQVEANDILNSDLEIKVTETEDSVIFDIEEVELEEVKPKKKTQTRKLNPKGGKK